MTKQEIIKVLKANGFTDKQITEKYGGIEVVAEKRVQMFEFDYREFVEMFKGDVNKKYIHFLDNWTFMIECE